MLFLFLHIFLYELPLIEPTGSSTCLQILGAVVSFNFYHVFCSKRSTCQHKNSPAIRKSCFRKALISSTKILFWLQSRKI